MAFKSTITFDELYDAFLSFADEKLLYQEQEVCRCTFGELYDEYCNFSGFEPSKNSVFPLIMNQFIAQQINDNVGRVERDEPEIIIYKKKNVKLYYYGITLVSNPDYPELKKLKHKNNRSTANNNCNRRRPAPPSVKAVQQPQSINNDSPKQKPSPPALPSLLDGYGYDSSN